mgnify:CR=1 FL=1
MSRRRLTDSKLIVTGAANGIGRAAALQLAEEGARILVADRDARGGEETCRLIREAGGTAFFHETDVSQEASVRDMVAKAVSAGLGVREVSAKVNSLERVFHELTTRAVEAPTEPSDTKDPPKDAPKEDAA